MLIVAPRGSTKEETSREQPSFSWQFFMFTGRQAAEEQVVNAMSIASVIPLKNFIGEIPPHILAMLE